MNPRWRIASAALLLLVGLALAELTWLYPGAFNNTLPLGSLPPDGMDITTPTAQPDARPGRVVIILVDGLRADIGRELPQLSALAGRGSALTLEAPLPSLSRPSYAAMVAGTTPERTGLRSNRYDRPVVVDTLLTRAHEAGRGVIGVSDLSWWRENHGAAFDHFEFVPPGAPDRLDAAVQDALGKDAGVILIHLLDVDRAGHDDGVGDAYRRAAQEADDRIGRWAAQLDLTRDALVVIADHGHLDHGGHGGDEPEVRAVPWVVVGRGFATSAPTPTSTPADAPETATVATLGPTLSVLLGLPFPRDLSAAPTWSALDRSTLGATYLEARATEWRDHRTRYERAWLDHVRAEWSQRGRFDNPVVEASATSADADLDTLREVRRRTLDAIEEHRLLGRTPLIALVIAVFGVLGLVALLRGNRATPMLAVLAFATVVVAAQVLAAHPFTLSAVTTWTRFWSILSAGAVVGFLVYLAALEGLLRLAGPRRRAEARHAHLALAALCLGGVAVTAWVVSGFWLDAPLPSPTLLYLPWWAGANAAAFALLAALTLVVTPTRDAQSQATPLPSAEPSP